MIIPCFCNGDETIMDLSWGKGTNRSIVDIYYSNNGIDYIIDSSGYDAYSPTLGQLFTNITLANPVTPGWNYFKLTANGKNAASSSYYILVYGLRLR